MRPMLPNDKKKKMVSFMLSPEGSAILDNMFVQYKNKLFRRFTKTDIFEMAIRNLAQDLTKSTMQDLYNKFIERKGEV